MQRYARGRMSEPSLTSFEKEIHDAADPVFGSGKSGYHWEPVDAVLKSGLALDGKTRCKKATNSGRAANVLTESNDKQIELYVVFIGPQYSIKSFIPVATDRVKRFPNVKTVAVADRTSGTWRVRAIVEREGIGLAERLRDAFPAVDDDGIHLVESHLESDGAAEESAVPSVPIVDEDEFASAMMGREAALEDLSTLPTRLVEFAGQRGVMLDASLATDLLATVLSSQLLMFAGPSGTGKSTVARLLSEFFAPVDHRFEIEALRQWLTPDDLVGYYSVLGRQYATAPHTQTIVALHEASVAPLASDDGNTDGPPILLIEEMNLSAPEGYLAPVIHGLSGISESYLRWNLHTGGTEAIDEATVVALPQVALIGPYPRIFGTINVDVSAQAPARKVAARSAVILLEPIELTSDELTALAASATTNQDFEEEPVGEDFLGDPLAALGAASEKRVSALTTQLQEFVGELDGLPVSRREATRCLAYMAYFSLLSGDTNGAGDGRLRLAVENAFAHCILPTVEPGRFATILEALADFPLMDPASDPTELGGLLKTRVQRLLGLVNHGPDVGATIDFWSALS